ncbi:MAG: prepilin peptidase [Acidobacteriaceae bacterium]
MPPPSLFELLGFLLGLLFGSFLNVCISRLPEHESIVAPRSRCMACGHTIRWYDNIPILSWLLLRARCRDCKALISWRYPAVELAVALWFYLNVALLETWFALSKLTPFFRPFNLTTIAAVIHNGGFVLAWSAQLLLEQTDTAILGFLLIGLMVMDWRTQRLPDAFTLTGIAIGFALTCAKAFFLAPGEGDIVLNTTHQLRLSSPGSFAAQGNVLMTGAEAMVLGRIAAIAGAALLLLVIRWIYKALRKRDGMGLGDVKLLAMIAAFLGFGESLVALFAGVLAASIYGITLLARKKAGGATKLPLGSFIAAGGLFAALFGHPIVDWYVSLLR